MKSKSFAKCLLILMMLWTVFGVSCTHAQTPYIESVQRQVYQDILRKNYCDSVRAQLEISVSDLTSTVSAQDSLLNNAGGIIAVTKQETKLYKDLSKDQKRQIKLLKGGILGLVVVILLIVVI